MRLSLGYSATPFRPAWGEPTAGANFCEEDYYITAYLAEFINTLSNSIYIIYALPHLRHGPLTAQSLPSWGLLSVGIGSALFHGSLKHSAQFCDGSSMLAATMAVLHQLLAFDRCKDSRPHVSFFCLMILIAMCSVHLYLDDLTIHGIMFVVLLLFVAWETRRLIRRVESRKRRETMGRLARNGAVCFAVGYALWLIDVWACDSLRVWRRAIGMPLGFLLELHGWWHILSGIGAYIFIALSDVLTSSNARSAERRFYWPVSMVVAEVDRKAK